MEIISTFCYHIWYCTIGNANLDFEKYCMYAEFDKAKYLYNTYPYINIKQYSEHAFSYACKYNDIKFAKWILNIDPDININMYNDQPFVSVCLYSDIEFIKWLLKICPKINIAAQNDSAFRQQSDSYGCNNYRAEEIRILLAHYDPRYYRSIYMFIKNSHKSIWNLRAHKNKLALYELI